MSWNRADDGEQYEAARRLNAAAGRTWTVMWAPGLRAYVAFYQGEAAVRWQSAPTAEGLMERLREAERRLETGTGRVRPSAPRGNGDDARTTGAHRRPPAESLPHTAATPARPPFPLPAPAPNPPTVEPPTAVPGRPAPVEADGADDRPATDARVAGSLPRAFGAAGPEGVPAASGVPARGGTRSKGAPARTVSRAASRAALRRSGPGGDPDRAVVTARLRGPRTGTRTVVIPGEGPPRGPLGIEERVRGGSAS